MTQTSFPIARLILLAFLIVSTTQAAKPPDVTLTGHVGPVVDIAFSKDGALLASTGDDGILKLWDIASKKLLFTYDGVRSNVNDVRFTPDGKYLVALGSSNNIVVLDVATGKPVRSIPLPDMIGGGAALDLSPDGAIIAVVGRSKLRLIDLATGATKAEYAVHAGYGVMAVAFSPDAKLIATAGSDNAATVLEAASGKILRTIKIRLNGVAVAISLDGKTLFTAASDRTVQSFDLASGADKLLVDKLEPIFKLAVSRDGKTLVLSGPRHGPWLVSLPDGVLAEPAFNSEEWVKCSAISPDVRWLAGGGNGGSVFLWKNGN